MKTLHLASLLAALAFASPVLADVSASDGLGTWEGSGIATDAAGSRAAPFTVTLVRRSLGDGVVRSDGTFHMKDGKELLSDESLDRIMARLDPSLFVRVHRSAIVNLELVKELEQEGERNYVAVLAEPLGTRVPIARDRLDEVKSRLGV